jgi:hypothetical protein
VIVKVLVILYYHDICFNLVAITSAIVNHSTILSIIVIVIITNNSNNNNNNIDSNNNSYNSKSINDIK